MGQSGQTGGYEDKRDRSLGLRGTTARDGIADSIAVRPSTPTVAARPGPLWPPSHRRPPRFKSSRFAARWR
eukprot:39610-Prymnesium_polylepis.1